MQRQKKCRVVERVAEAMERSESVERLSLYTVPLHCGSHSGLTPTRAWREVFTAGRSDTSPAKAEVVERSKEGKRVAREREG
jgi:hypothetical protein